MRSLTSDPGARLAGRKHWLPALEAYGCFGSTSHRTEKRDGLAMGKPCLPAGSCRGVGGDC